RSARRKKVRGKSITAWPRCEAGWDDAEGSVGWRAKRPGSWRELDTTGVEEASILDLELHDKVAIVGGASKGLGRACAEALAQEGAKVTICSRTQADLEQAAQEIRDTTGVDVLVCAGDLDNYDTIRNLIGSTVNRFGRLDIMINNSGGPPLARAYNATEEQWATAVQRSLLFFARMSREAIPHLKRQGGGRIINILASTVYQPIPN